MYPIRVEIMLFGCLMVHLQRVFDNPKTRSYAYIKAFPKIRSWFYLINHLYIL